MPGSKMFGGSIVLAALMGATGCSNHEEDSECYEREAQVAVEQFEEEVAAFDDGIDVCIEQAWECAVNAQTSEDFEGCAEDFHACLPEMPEPPEMPPGPGAGDSGGPEIPGIPGGPELPGLPTGFDECTDAAFDCLQAATSPEEAEACVSDSVDEQVGQACEQAIQACTDAGAPAEICDQIANSEFCQP